MIACFCALPKSYVSQAALAMILLTALSIVTKITVLDVKAIWTINVFFAISDYGILRLIFVFFQKHAKLSHACVGHDSWGLYFHCSFQEIVL